MLRVSWMEKNKHVSAWKHQARTDTGIEAQSASRYCGIMVRRERGKENDVMLGGNEWEDKARKT